MSEEKKEKVENQLFYLSQKVLFYDPDQQKFLLLESAKDKDGDLKIHQAWYKKFGPWDLPGGRVDEGEKDLSKAVMREIREETGIVLEDHGDISSLMTMENPAATHRAVYAIYLAQEFIDVTLSEEHVAVAWMSAQEVEDHKDIKPWLKEVVARAVEKIEQVEAHEKMLRTLAEFDNYKKRSAENQKDFAAYASESVIMEMLPVLDNFHAATEHVPEEQKDSPWLTGIMFIQQQMDKVFEDQGVSEVVVNVGDTFDTQTMEAVEEGNNEKEGDKKGEKVVKIVQKGYKIKDKIIRPARVVVG